MCSLILPSESRSGCTSPAISFWRAARSVAGDLDAMGFGQQHAEQLLGEVGVDAGLDCLLPPGGHDVADAGGLDDRGVGAFLHRGNLTADSETFGDDRDQRAVELIDARAEVVEFGHCVHRTCSAALHAL